MNCLNCNIEFDGRKDAKYCSPKCRVTFSRKQSLVTDNVTFSEPDVTDNFKFTIKAGNNNPDDVRQDKGQIRTAKYWYDVPLSALPVVSKGSPKMPEYMNGRQYFLWWKNNFAINDTGEPLLHNPFRITASNAILGN